MSLCQCPFVCKRHSVFTNVLRVIIFDVIESVVGERGRRREVIPMASDRYHQENEIKTGIFGCGSFGVACFQPAVSIEGGGDSSVVRAPDS